MRATLSLLFITFLLKSTLAQEPQPGLQVFQELIKEKPIIALGEVHGHQQLYDFLTELLTNTPFFEQIDAIVIESGNALYQDVLDQYISGNDVQMEELSKVWLNTSQSPVDPWNIDVYQKLLTTVRTLNQEKEHQVRILAGDPAFDWASVNNPEEYREERGSRNAFYADIVMKEVLAKNKKALLISGGAHFGNHNPRGTLVNQRIEKEYPNSVYVISSPAGLGRANKEKEKEIAHWPLGSILKVKDTWIGKLPGPSRRRLVSTSGNGSNSNGTASPPAAPLKEAMFDYLLYFGSADKVEYGNPMKDIYDNDDFWEELNRRSLARFNHKLIPETRKTGELRPIAYQ